MKVKMEDVARLAGCALTNDTLREAEVTELLTDSRSLLNPAGTLFFAIPTRTNAGGRYMRSLYDRGVRLFVAPEIPEDMRGLDDAAIVIASDPVALLQKLASRRSGDGVEVVAITGSRGKTTLKEWLFQLLEPLREVARSPRSYNSQIGVPLSMWEISEDTDLALIEAGISRSGEMERLADCIAPDTVILTDMGPEHAEGFASIEEKVAQKVSLASGENVKRIIYCSDDKIVAKAVESVPQRVERFDWGMNNVSARLNITAVKDTTDSCGNPRKEIRYSFDGHQRRLMCDLQSEADVRNACPALAFMLAEGYDADIILRRFSKLHPVETRLSVSDGGNGCSIVYDSYTSDFSSLVPAVDFMMRRRVAGQASVVILSDLRHEAHGDADDYERIAELMRLRGIDHFIGVGPALQAHSGMFGKGALFFGDTISLLSWLRENPLSDSVVLLKGAPEYDFHKVKEALEMRTHETILEVNLDAMIRNYNYFKSHMPAECGLVAMVKASGYGVGSYEIAKTLQDAGAAYLAVAVLDEGLDIRRRGVTMPLMVMNPRVADYREMFANRLEPVIFTFAMLDDVIAQARRYGVTDFPIHIKLDTGMHRIGFIEEELPELMARINGQENVRIASVFSHLATADCPDMNEYTQFQLDTFDRCSGYIVAEAKNPVKRHVLNSAGILRFSDRYHYDMGRLGIGLYGVNTLPEEMERPLATVATLKTVIMNIREWPAETSVGYARRGMLHKASKVATIPIGYADGMNRRFGNGAIRVLVNGHEVPTIGNICMDACMIDVSGVDCKIGDSVEIFGERMPIYRLSDLLGTIPYEVLTSVSPRVKRVYYRE